MIRAGLQGDLVTDLAVRKTLARDVVERIAVRQLRVPQGGQLLRCPLQFELGRDDLFHRTSVPTVHRFVKKKLLMNKDAPTACESHSRSDKLR
jgi:hypothetical protein